MPNIIYIHGGNIRETDEKYREYLSTASLEYKIYDNSPLWPDNIRQELPTDQNILTPRFPRKERAQYDERKLIMDRCLEFITPKEPVIWVGRSLGALFLAKYLSKHPQRVDQLHLVAGVYDAGLCPDQYSVGYFPDGRDLPNERISKLQSYHNIHLRHSTDDFVVEYEHTASLHQQLDQSTLHTFHDRNHFLQPDFPELRAEIHQGL